MKKLQQKAYLFSLTTPTAKIIDGCGFFSQADIRNAYMKGVEAVEPENKLLKSLLWQSVRSCDNCGFVKCENYQRQRKDCCERHQTYKERIMKLEQYLQYVIDWLGCHDKNTANFDSLTNTIKGALKEGEA